MKKIILLLLLCLPAYAEDMVVLLHGIGRTAKSLHSIETLLIQQGYTVLNLNYPSTTLPLEGIRDHIHPSIKAAAALAKQEGGQVHFVTHSMGGLVARAYLNVYRPTNMGRVVMLSPPNQGSEVADFLTKHANGLYTFFYGPAGQQLVTTLDMQDLFGDVTYPLGIITGDRTWMPVSSFIIKGADDGKVSVELSKLEGMASHKVIHATHTFIMKNKIALKHITSFLKYGQFHTE